MTNILRKLLLLLWKNWIMEWNNKRQFLRQIIPYQFVLLVFLRTLLPPEHEGETIFGPNDTLPINNLNLYRMHPIEKRPMESLVYSPNTSRVFRAIAEQAASSLNLAYMGCANADALETVLIEGEYFAGVEFSDSLADIKQYPDKLRFRIRFPNQLRTSRRIFMETWSTNMLFDTVRHFGPRNKYDIDGGNPPGYLREGFLPVQNAISVAFIQQSARRKYSLPEISLQRYPYAGYIDDVLLLVLSQFLGFFIVMSFSLCLNCAAGYIIIEKEKQLKEVMKILGLQNWLHWTAWFVKTFTIMGLLSLLITVAIKNEWFSNAAILPNSSHTAIFFFMLIYTIATVTFCFMLTTFFSNGTIALVVVTKIFFLTFILFSIINDDTLTWASKIGWSLISNIALGFGLEIIVAREIEGVGLQWNNMFEQVSADESLTMAQVLGVMCFSSAVQMMICLYMEQVFPGEYGVPKKWNFPFTRTFWSGEHRRDYIGIRGDPEDHVPKENTDSFEAEPTGKTVGVQVKNLSKQFGQVKVVKNLSMNMYEGEITVLLGHNGAGKTTTISMLTGMIPPTSGTAIINGCDIRTNMDGARRSLGICPQYNILFDLLTVSDHLVFYSTLKGVKRGALNAEIEKYLKKFGLEEKANVAAKKLSGGMQRKLSVCTAFCGGSKVVFCDEPSSAMDPAARRQLWNLLQSEKTGRTVLLTTHLMDEADVLGSRIAIMSSGELKCMGSSFFLKKRFGYGYRLICVKRENCDSSKVTQLLGKYIPNIHPEMEIGTELSYQLPDQYSPQFEKIFQDLETSSNNLGLSGFGISNAPLEAVFMKVGTETAASSKFAGTLDVESMNYNQRLVKGTILMFSQWRAMLLKKYLYTIRNKFLFAIQNIIPLLYLVGSIYGARAYSAAELQPITFSLTQYPSTVTVLDSSNVVDGTLEAKISRNYKRVVDSYSDSHEFVVTGDQNFIDFILNLGNTIQNRIDKIYIAGATISPGKITAWLNNQPLHSAPLTVNLIHNALAKTFIHENVKIEVTNAPLPVLNRTKNAESVGSNIALTFCVSMAFVTAIYVFFPIKECESRSKLLQFISGARVLTFWLSHFAWDLFMFTITSLILVVALACFQEEGYSTFDELGRVLLIMLIFGCAAIPFTYLLGRMNSEPITGFIWVCFVNFLGTFLFIIWLIQQAFEDYRDKWESYFLVSPHFSLAHSLNILYTNTQLKKMCDRLAEETGPVCDPDNPVCCDPQPYFRWDPPGIGRAITYLLGLMAASSSLLILSDCRIFGDIWSLIRGRMRSPPPRSDDEPVDEDVEAEKKRIQNMSRSEISAQNLTIDKLTRFYGKFVAVNQISVGVRHSECFGLLGVNGAGKTTTFKMLTGEERISMGEAYVKGIRLKTRMNRVRQDIGYCPQFDGLLNDFTGRETLKIFALLRGIPDSKIRRITSALARSFDFRQHYDKKVRFYSGGNKRKLSAAIAMLGRPSVIYLDEPTTGIDPGARRQVWNMVSKIREAGKTIILTTHSMEECEALSTRLAIMVNGEFKCIGSTQHLKNRFSKGLSLKIKIKRDKLTSTVDLTKVDDEKPLSTELRKVFSFIKQIYPDAVLQERYEGLLTFYIPLSTIQWSKMFGLMEANKAALDIEDYAISQTTLEEIFLQFAKYQQDQSSEAK